MSLKAAWLNLQDGLGNRFAWSHVNAIYYSYAQKKLLKEKLDDIDTAINAKVAKTDIVQVESTATDKVPSCAYIKNIKDELDGDIAELNSKGQGFFAMDGSLKTLPELIALNGVYMYGAIIWISWDSAIAADANNMICIANANVIWGFSFTGKIFYYNNTMATAEWKEWNPSTV